MPVPDAERVTRIVEAVARDIILPRFGKLAPEMVRAKGPGDLVTEVDHASEERLTAELRELLPGSVVVGEEAASADPAIVGRIAEEAAVWVVDPLDGTANYVNGVKRFATIVALVREGETVAGWIHLPYAGITATALRGEGAWIGAERLAAGSGRGALERLDGGFSLPKVESPYRAALERLAASLRSRHRLTCAGADYIDAASGRVGVTVFRSLHPWDHAAGVLIHAEAGGYGALLDGRPYRPTLRTGPLMLTQDALTWDAARAIIGDVAEQPA